MSLFEWLLIRLPVLDDITASDESEKGFEVQEAGGKKWGDEDCLHSNYVVAVPVLPTGSFHDFGNLSVFGVSIFSSG